MDVIFEQYFDFSSWATTSTVVLEGFWQTLQLSIVGGVLSLVWGLVLALLRQLPGQAAGARPLA